jgi:two-component system LytT family response regulator
VRVEDVESIHAADHYIELRTERETHLIRDSLSAIAQHLDPKRFVRIHRSTLVNVDRVKELRPAFHGEFDVLLASRRVVFCSRTYARALTRALSA